MIKRYSAHCYLDDLMQFYDHLYRPYKISLQLNGILSILILYCRNSMPTPTDGNILSALLTLSSIFMLLLSPSLKPPLPSPSSGQRSWWRGRAQLWLWRSPSREPFTTDWPLSLTSPAPWCKEVSAHIRTHTLTDIHLQNVYRGL